jgi:transcriptional regulator with XRE-family HTH domain
MVKEGVAKMQNRINTAKLRAKRVENGYSMESLSKKIGRTAKAYENKEKGITEFTRYEIFQLIAILKLSVKDVFEIFFASELTEMLKMS